MYEIGGGGVGGVFQMRASVESVVMGRDWEERWSRN
jgi:hypothetical protein